MAEKKLDQNQIASLVMLAMTAVVLVAFQQKLIGWSMYGLAVLFTALGTKANFRKHILLVYLSLALLGLIPITTDITNVNFLRMGSVLVLALVIPFYISRKVFKDGLIRYQFLNGRRWTTKEIGYLIFAAIASYLFLPFYLENTGAYLNWGVENTAESITRLFIGTNALGIWDELFFVSTVLGVLRKYLKFSWANMLQAVLFTSFLYELGFTGWGPLVIYPFALLQGYIFKKSESLLYVIAIHLTIDFFLFLALLNAFHPQLADIFIT
ncbi:MAG: CPBP family intramembrane glutamic endopeptidase [Candidatus Saccharimonadales bacterium]|nr:CPBP family intramembrane glutamic endopeptidase [Candidatus Saccharimonadales bacterium]